jgi:hypothetical protein
MAGGLIVLTRAGIGSALGDNPSSGVVTEVVTDLTRINTN